MSFSAVVLALFMCALVTGIAAYTEAIALALAASVLMVANGVHEHLEQAESVMQVVKLGMDARDQRLSEFRKKVLEILYDPQCHLNHDVRDHVGWCVFAALYFAPGANALLVFVDLCALDLLNANDHFAMSQDVFKQRQNGQNVFATQCAGAGSDITLISVALIKFTLDGKNVLAKQFGTAGHNSQRRCLDGRCLDGSVHFLYQQ